MQRSVAMVTMGCSRNDVDSEELASRLSAAGWTIVADADEATAVIVNTCGFIDAAKKDSIDTILALADGDRPVVAVGCMAERYGRELAEALDEAHAVLGFDDYPQIAERLTAIVAGERLPAHEPRDRRLMLPVTPLDRPSAPGHQPGHGQTADTASPGWQPPVLRYRLDDSPIAPVKLASGCDRRCTFCAIPTFRGAFVSRPAADVMAEIAWLADQGVREAVLVSENSTSYGKDLGDPALLERMLAGVADTGITRVRVAYLQPAEVRPGLIDALAGTSAVAAYFDLSFQHASESVLRRMRRFGGGADFLGLLDRVRDVAPTAGVRSNVIVGFPGETEQDLEVLCDFLGAARLDAIGVFGYSDEEGTQAAALDGKLSPGEIADRVGHVSALAETLMAERAEERIGETVRIIVVGPDEDGDGWLGRADHQGPDDGAVHLAPSDVVRGSVRRGVVEACDGPDLFVSTHSDDDSRDPTPR